MSTPYVTGTQAMINRIMLAKSKVLANIAVAVESTSVAAANHAKDNHSQLSSHDIKRYINRTTLLTASIKGLLDKVSVKAVTGIVFATMEYAEHVEVKYPFIYPALLSEKENFKKRLQVAMKGGF